MKIKKIEDLFNTRGILEMSRFRKAMKKFLQDDNMLKSLVLSMKTKLG